MLLEERKLWAKRYIPNCQHTVKIRVDNIGGDDWDGEYRVLKCLMCGVLEKDHGENTEAD